MDKFPQDELVAQAIQGDLDALGRLLSGARASLLKVARWIVNDPNEAEDVVQEATLKIIGNLNTLRDNTWKGFAAWARRVVKTTAVDFTRRRVSESLDWLASAPSREPQPGDGLACEEARKWIAGLLAKVARQSRPHQYGVLLLSNLATPDSLGITLNTARQYRFLAMRQMRIVLEHQPRAWSDYDE